MPETSRFTVLGRSRLIVDIIRGVLTEQLANGHRPVAVLVDPDPEHWREVGDLPCVVVTSDADADVLAAIRRGAEAVVDADDVVDELPGIVAAVQDGGAVLTPAQARVVIDALRGGGSFDQPTLTRRETDIIRSILAGESVKQTAKTLGIAPKTVENLQSRLFKKLKVRNRAQAVARVHQLGLLEGLNTPHPAGGDHP